MRLLNACGMSSLAWACNTAASTAVRRPRKSLELRACRARHAYDRGLTAINVQQAIGRGAAPKVRKVRTAARARAHAVEATSSPTPPKQIHKVTLECRVPGDGKRQINQRLDFLIQRRRGERPLFGDGIRRRQRYLLPLFLFGRVRDGPSALTGLQG